MNQKQRKKLIVQPTYPTKLDATSQADWLGKYLPPSWQKLMKSGGAIAVFFAGSIAGCSREPSSPASPQATTRPDSAGNGAKAPTVTMAAVVAPIFEHGDGRAATGCVVIAPPVFLSEEEAIAVVQDELNKNGLVMSQAHVPIQEVQLGTGEEEKETYERYAKPKIAELTAKLKDANLTSSQRENLQRELEYYHRHYPEPGPLKVDLEDPQKHVAVEFVSQDDYYAIGGKQSMSTVQEYNFKALAAGLKERLEHQARDRYFGVFYDPAGHADRTKLQELNKKYAGDHDGWKKAWQEAEDSGKLKSRELLRQQVRDFVMWLKQRRVI